jgi:tetratricopeptide (TPR) repeat protein
LGRGEIGIRRQGENLAVERFREQVQDVRGKTQDKTTVLGLEPGVLDPERQQNLSEEDAPFRYLNQGTSVEDPRSKFEPQIPAESTTGVKQTAAPRYRLPSLDEFSPSMDPKSQKDLILQQGANWSATSKGLQTVQERPVRGTLEALEMGRRNTTGQLSTGSRLIGTGQDQEQRDVLGRIKQQLDDLTKSVETGLQTEPDHTRKAGSTELASRGDETRSGAQPYVLYSREAARQGRIDSSNALSLYAPRRVESSFKQGLAPATTGGVLGRAGGGRQTRFEFPEMPSYESSQERGSPLDELSKLSQADLSAEARRIMGPHKSRESFSEAKFNQHMQAAEDYLKAGRYYHAADSFALASIYKANDPRPLAGRGHALFAAGEYVSSALFLSRAMAMGPESAQTKIDLVAMLGGESKLAGKLADVEQWLARSNSTELLFLLSYVHYRTGSLTHARHAIEAAYEKTPQSPAVRALRTAIDDATTKP